MLRLQTGGWYFLSQSDNSYSVGHIVNKKVIYYICWLTLVLSHTPWEAGYTLDGVNVQYSAM